MAHIRKLRRKWQVQVRKQKIKVTKSFWKKGDASKWALKTEAQIETGSYLKIKKAERLNEIKLSELLDISFNIFIGKLGSGKAYHFLFCLLKSPTRNSCKAFLIFDRNLRSSDRI